MVIAGLVKRYDGRTVVDGLDLTVARGDILAMLGPNGAGKTTTIEIIEGYRRPDEGTVEVLGLDPRADRAALRARVGVMLQRADLYNQVRVLEAVRLFAAFYAAPLSPVVLLDQVGLADRADDRYRTLSGGERQRLNLALALVGRPELIILDEPTAAMDVAARRSTWDLLQALRANGTTVVLTTHLIEEAEALADRVAIIDGGRLVACGSPTELRAIGGYGTGTGGAGDDGGRSIRLRLPTPLDPAGLAALSLVPGVSSVRHQGGAAYALTVSDAGEALVRLSEWLWAKRIEPLAIEVGSESLEAVFLRLTTEAPDPPEVQA
ncbi:MAG TPA: ABC transporter ATP-binding protein [Candidatus Saccharimonadia bacterium]|nr:ABC transporter ATP-binding protein [Candidatus Saccharimonadia bacterium]